MTAKFQTVDVFTDQRFTGNPLAVFPDAAGLSDAEMQALAAELNLSETTFVLTPKDPANTARIRIFNPTAEMPFAGHPMIGTAFVLACTGVGNGETMTFEVPAGLVSVALENDGSGQVVGGTITAPQPLTTGSDIPVETLADCLGIDPQDVVTSGHRPLVVSVGHAFIMAQVTQAALPNCLPDLAAFRRAAAQTPEMGGRFAVHVYAGTGDQISARMFAPLAGTFEDPATGSANAALAALLLSLGSEAKAQFTIRQGVKMGRPSLIRASAWRKGSAIRASVGGRCVPVFSGAVNLSPTL